MTDQASLQNVPLLVPESFTAIGVSLTASEIVITLGQTRVALMRGEKNEPSPTIVSEFNRSISLPPNVALGLVKSLNKAIELYENNFGKIPIDPNASMSMTEEKVLSPSTMA